MTKSGEQKLRVLAIIVLLISMFFYLESGGVSDWKMGTALLMLSVLCGIDVALSSSKSYRFIEASLFLFFLVFFIKNFLAY